MHDPGPEQLFLTLTFFVKTTLLTRKEYVDAYVNHVFNTSVQDVFEEFKRGFFQVCDSELVQLFRPEELHRMLVGKDVYDWTKLKQVHSESQIHFFLYVKSCKNTYFLFFNLI